MSRTKAFAAAAAVAATLGSGTVPASDVTFDPRVDLYAYHDGNVNNVGEEKDPDNIVRLGLNLDLSVRKPSSSWAFNYRPFREVYDNFSERNYTGHNASVDYTRSGSERTKTDARVNYYRTQRREFDPAAPEVALIYTERSTYESASLRLGGDVASGRRSSVTWGVSGRMTSQDDIRDPVTQEIVTDFNDSQAGGVSVGWAYRKSETSSIGGAYTFEVVSFDRGPSTNAHTVAFTQSLTVGRHGNLDYSLGVLRGDTGGDTSTNGAVNANYRWTTGPQSTFSAGARQGISAGDGLTGTTLDRGAYVNWVYTRPRSWGVGVTMSYWDLQPLNETPGVADPPSALTVSENFSFPLGSYLRAGIFHFYRHQTGSAELTSNYHSYGMALRWSIFGDRRAR